MYLFLNSKGEVIYVGKAKNLKKRVASYFVNGKNLGYKTAILVSQISKIKTIKVESEIESLLLEANLIKKYLPKYNINLKDGKAYPLIRITVKDKYPKVLIARRESDPKSLYFGPFPNAGAMRLVLKTVRRIFPFQSVINHPKKPCFYYHLGLCPCPEVFKDKTYRTTVKHIIGFLNGQTGHVIKDLEKEREKYSRAEYFEQAGALQEKIDAIKLVTGKFYKPYLYEENPNLKEDIRRMELQELRNTLNAKNVDVRELKRIECYDISNTSGKNATGSMVVFTNGEKDTSSYRKFKIKGKYNDLPNDFAMMEEVLKRRLTHTEWEKPDLIIVDGGKGQVSSALKVINGAVPLIGLAKREEIIITSDFREIRLKKHSKQLQLIMRIRDEAHRFAITYHRKLRAKNTYN
ncbi:MAG: excinuclease ABC subunit UvrC [Patescibacteria group bacterium]|nr:excinuclease ABC subunit UvrC [Patescibacteria group bacterium]